MAPGGPAGEAHYLGLATRGRQGFRGGRPYDFRVIGIGDDQPGALGPERGLLKQAEVEAGRHRPEITVTIVEIVLPLAVTEEVGTAALDLYGDQAAACVERQDVEAPPIGERHFREAEYIVAREQAKDAARDARRRPGSVRTLGRAGRRVGVGRSTCHSPRLDSFPF